MIKSESIQAVKDRMDIVDVVSNYIKLDRNNKACCPFHAEKSPSFQVSAKRQMYKCFGCGESGDAIKFVMSHQKLDFMQAIEWLANRYNVTLEEKKETEQEKKKREQQKDLNSAMITAVQFAQNLYLKNLLTTNIEQAIWRYMQERGITKETAINWGFGFAPDEWQFLTSPIINAGNYEPALQAGLIRTKDGKTYDFYRNRLIIPIHNIHGQIIGIAGRWIPTGEGEKDKNQAKYINPIESPIYQKSKTLYGLYQALTSKAFTKNKGGVTPPAFIVEGYLDVIAMHESGLQNTVAACGTSITIDQIRLLKRYTNHFILFTDGDSSGKQSAIKTIDMCLQENIRTEVIELPENHDPHSYILQFSDSLQTKTI